MPDGSHRGDVGVEKTGLAKAPRCCESDRHAISGRALERTVAEVQRFLVRNLGGDLLLLYPEEWK